MHVCAPIGTPEERASGKIWPGNWIDATGYAVKYEIRPGVCTIHTGADLNLNKPFFDLDAHSAVVSIADGVVLYAARPPGSNSGNVIIIDYSEAAGEPLIGRYWHAENMLVTAGRPVKMGERIASVGNAFGSFPYHLHFDLCFTDALRPGQADKKRGPTFWPGTVKGVLENFHNVKLWLQQHVTPGEIPPMTEPTTLYVQPAAGLRLRTAPNGTVLRTLAQNTEVQGFETELIGAIVWQRVTTASGPGWMGAREGTTIYLATTRVGAPPIPVGPTPYDTKNALWLWHPTGTTVAAFLQRLDNVAVNALFVKTSDGANWQGVNDPHPTLGIFNADSVQMWVDELAARGDDFHAWAVLNGLDVDGEAQRIIDVCNVPGVKSIILDIEPYADFWQGPRENVRAIMQKVRASIPTGFHIGISIDPRPQHYAAIFSDDWKPFVDSVHPQCYWVTFQEPPDVVLQTAYNTWAGFGKPIIPVLQGNAVPADIVAARRLAVSTYKAQGLSFWRDGVMDAAQLAAMDDTPDPVETLETTARINIRSKPSTTGVVRRVLDKGTLIRAQGHYSGTGANDWGKLPDEPVESYAARDFMRTPVIVVPPPAKREMFVWSNPHSNIRAEPDLQAPDVGDLVYGTKVAIEEIGMMADGYKWGKIGDGRFVAIEEQDGFPKLLQHTPPPIIILPPPHSKGRISSPIGVHYQLPANPDQREKLIAMCDVLHRAGKPLSVVTIVNDAWLVAEIRRVSPTTWINFRVVFSDRDKWPDFANNETGDTWFAYLWPHLSQGVGASSYQFANEWYSKETDVHTLTAWANMYTRLCKVCRFNQVICTVGDFSMGTIEDYHMDIFDEMFRTAAELGCPLDYHSYSANNRDGATNLSAGAEWFFMRWEKIAKKYPTLKILGGEIGNSGDGNDGHLFRPETPALMRQGAQMLTDSPYAGQYIGGAWWEIVDPRKGDFGMDDFTPILPEMQRDLLAWKP
jgi:hypothetical protein